MPATDLPSNATHINKPCEDKEAGMSINMPHELARINNVTRSTHITVTHMKFRGISSISSGFS